MHTIWTEPAARSALIRESKKHPERGFLPPLPHGRVIERMDGERIVWNVAHAVERVGHRDPDDGLERQQMVMAWAIVMANGGSVDASLTAIFADCGWNKSTFKRKVDEGFHELCWLLHYSLETAWEVEQAKAA